MKSSPIQRQSRPRERTGRPSQFPAAADPESYLQNPEGAKASFPKAAENPAVAPVPAGPHAPLNPQLAAALKKVQWRRGYVPVGVLRRNASVARLRGHPVHGRGW